MTILYHHRTLLDGAEGIHITEMVRAFESLGHEVKVTAPGGQNGRPGAVPRLVRRALPQGLFECAAAAHNTIERRQARRLIDELRPALVYKRHALNDVSVLRAARDRGVPSVLEVNAFYSSDALQAFEPLRLRGLARRMEARALSLADLVVTVSSPLRDLVHALVPTAQVVVLPNGADPVQFSPEIDGAPVRDRYGLPRDALVAGWSGVLRSWHALDLLLEAVAARDRLMLLVIGDGPDRPRIEEHAAALGIGGRVRFTGSLGRDDVPGHLAAVDIGVVAGDRTGYASPMKLVEYMAMGKPVVAPDLPNIRDILTGEREGLLFEPGSAAALGACLDRLADVNLRTRLGQTGRALVVTDRNWVTIARSVLDALDAVTAGQRRAS